MKNNKSIFEIFNKRSSFQSLVCSLFLSLLVACGGGSSDTSVETPNTNSVPIADAGTDQNVTTGDIVNLDGSGSTDADNNNLSYTWSFSTRPDGSSATIENPASVSASFEADVDGEYIVSLVVNDGTLDSSADTMMITSSTVINNTSPTANAGNDQNITTGTTVNLDGTASSDPEGDSLNYSWSLTSIPAGSSATLNNATTATPSFIADIDGTYSLSLAVNDGEFDSAADTVTISVVTSNSAPVALDDSVSTDQDTEIDITLSATDADGDDLTYTIVSNPAHGTVTLSGSTATYTPTTSYTGSDSFTFKVNDGKADSNTVTISITVNLVSDCAEITPTYTFTIVDTNQTLCYDETTGDSESCVGEGQDADYVGNQPSYSRCSSEEITLDNNTGLMWQASSDKDGISGLTTDDKTTVDDATQVCEDLSLGNYTDWRLPSNKELVSIYLLSGEDLSGEPGASTNGTVVDTTGIEPFIDVDYFDVGYGDPEARQRMTDGQYATTTHNVTPVFSGITVAEQQAFFGVNFVDGHIKAYESDIDGITYYSRCVRGNEDYGNNNFVDNSDETISDLATNLMWQKNDSGTHLNSFSDALLSCEVSATAGHSDWRLPNMKELHSILDYSRSPETSSSPAIDTAFFNTTVVTNEGGQSDWAYFWSSTALLKSSGLGDKAIYITFGRGLGYFSTDGVVDVHGAGSQRSDGKNTSSLATATTFTPDAASSFGSTGYAAGPQGDILRPEYNYVRCVRDE